MIEIGADKGGETNDGSVERMRRKSVAIIGAQGKFGARLHRRLKDLKAPINIDPTYDRSRNVKLAARADLVALTVRPDSVESVLREIAPSLPPHAQVLSFVAHTSLESLSKMTGRPVARGMADPWWNLAAYVTDKDFDLTGYEFLQELGAKTIRLDNDRELEEFTVSICYLFAALLGDIPDQERHLEFLAPRLRCTVSELKNFKPDGDPRDALNIIATKGGVTEKILNALKAEPDVDPYALFTRMTH